MKINFPSFFHPIPFSSFFSFPFYLLLFSFFPSLILFLISFSHHSAFLSRLPSFPFYLSSHPPLDFLHSSPCSFPRLSYLSSFLFLSLPLLPPFPSTSFLPSFLPFPPYFAVFLLVFFVFLSSLSSLL